MCGIFAAAGAMPVPDVLVEGLRRLEYRGYDSAGIAVLGATGIATRKSAGDVATLAAKVATDRPEGRAGIAHTRWATHGGATEVNAHPHLAPGVAVVHNGIVENHAALRSELQQGNGRFVSETDTEVIPWLIRRELDRGERPWRALVNAARRLEGSYAAAMLAEQTPGEIYAARRGSPLLAGLGPDGAFLSSDMNALAGYAREAIALEEGDTVRLTRDAIEVRDAAGRPANRRMLPIQATPTSFDAGDHEHFMLKEIFEQPTVTAGLIDAYGDGKRLRELLAIDFSRVRRLRLVAAGTSYYAAAIARRWLQEHARLDAVVDIASEFRYEPLPDLYPGEVAVLISQSGETADTLAVLDRVQGLSMPAIGVVNDTGSTLARRADMVLPLMAGPEIGVASTKAFTAQLVVLAHLALHAAAQRGASAATLAALRAEIARTPALIEKALHNEPAVIESAAALMQARSAVFVGRGAYAALAAEGALKLKETSYIHAEAFASGELKHGPIALIDEQMPVFALAGAQAMQAKFASNLREIASRGGRITVIGDRDAILAMSDTAVRGLTIPAAPEIARPIVAAAPLQLLAYHAALARGLNVDRPRNLAKSVTVE